jgi:hypothetical protein
LDFDVTPGSVPKKLFVKIESADPARKYDLSERVEPRFSISSTESCDARREIPKTDKVLPMRAKLLMLSAEPM